MNERMPDRHRALGVVLIFSLAFNIAFVGIWLYHVLYVRPLLAKQALNAPAERRQAAALAGELRGLRLTAQQRARIAAMRRALAAQLEERLRKVEAAQEELLVLLQQPRPDQRRLTELADGISREQSDIRRLTLRHLLEVRNLLNERQRRELGCALRRCRRRRPLWVTPRAPTPPRRGAPERGNPGPPEGEVF